MLRTTQEASGKEAQETNQLDVLGIKVGTNEGKSGRCSGSRAEGWPSPKRTAEKLGVARSMYASEEAFGRGHR